MVQFILILLGAVGISFLIGFHFGGRVDLPSIRRRPRVAAEAGPGPEPPEPVARIEAAEPGDPVAGQPGTENGPVEAAGPGRGLRWRLRDDRGRAVGRVELVETRDAVVGPYLVQVEDYRLTIRTGLDYTRLLAPGAVAAALAELAAAPQDEQVRNRVVGALTSHGHWARGEEERQETLLLSVLGSERSALLDGVLILRSQGAVVGGEDRRRGGFGYALASNGEAAQSLDGNPALSRALAERFCPRGVEPPGPLDDQILAAIRPAAA